MDNYGYLIGFFALSLAFILYIIDALKTYKSENKLMDAIVNKLELDLIKTEFKEEDLEKQAREDCEAFTAYDIAIEDNRDEVSEYDVCIKSKVYEYNYTVNKIVDLCKYTDVIYKNPDLSHNPRHSMQIIVLFETSKKNKRLHIKCDPQKIITNKKNNEIKFEDVFTDYKDKVLEFDKCNFQDYLQVFNRTYNNKNNDENNSYEYLELSQNQKKLLLDLVKQSKLEFSFVIQNGVGRVRILFSNKIGNFESFRANEELIDNIRKLIISIIKEWN